MSRVAALLVLALAAAGCQRAASLEEPAPGQQPRAAIAPARAPAAPPTDKPLLDKPTAIPAHVHDKDKRGEYEQRVADARRTVDITLYGASWCPSCKQARAWLDQNGMAYAEHDIDSSEEAGRTMRRLNPAGTIPVIDVEGEVVVGFAPDAVDRAIRRKAERRVQRL